MSHIYTKLIGESLQSELVDRFSEITKIVKYKTGPGYNANWHTPTHPEEYLDTMINNHLESLEAAYATLAEMGVTEWVVYVTVTESLQGNFELSEAQVRKMAKLNAALAVTVVYGEPDVPPKRFNLT